MKKSKYARAIGILIASSAAVSTLCEPLHAKEKMEGTAAQRAACTPDVFRYCTEFIPNHQMITNCLEHNSYRLNKQCKKVFQGKLK